MEIEDEVQNKEVSQKNILRKAYNSKDNFIKEVPKFSLKEII